MVNVAPARDVAKRGPPDIAVKTLTAARQIPLRRPEAVEAAIEILCERVKADWIRKPACRLSADFHPLAVKNK